MADRSDEEWVADLLVQWEDAWDQGHDSTAEELCGDQVHLVEPLKKQIEDLKQSIWLKSDPTESVVGDRASELSGMLAGRYRIDCLIGEGGHGSVYKAFDEELQRQVAIKVSHLTSRSSSLLEEARRVAGLRHPGIVAVHDVGRDLERTFIVSELIDGETLASLIDCGTLSLDKRVGVIAAIADALQHAHANGFVHRDIKPSNIILDAQGRPFVTDFGIATTLAEHSDGRNPTSGTLAYMAPEQIAGETQLVDHRTDIYSLGVVMFETITGHLPYQARTTVAIREQILLRPPTPIRTYDPQLSKQLQRICDRCLAKHPADRYQSASEFGDALRQCRLRDGASLAWSPVLKVATIVLVLAAACVGIALLALRVQPRDAIYFDGRTRIVTQIERQLPITLEAWVRPDQVNRYDCQFFIGSDIPTRYGIGLGTCSSVLSGEYIGGVVKSDVAVFPEKWSHVAGVFTEDETRLYLNGALIATGPGGVADEPARFVLGNVGELNPIDYYQGRIRAARITSGERYTESFTPAPQFDSDEATQLLLTASNLDGDLVLDASGQVIGKVETLGD